MFWLSNVRMTVTDLVLKMLLLNGVATAMKLGVHAVRPGARNGQA
jgi:hypothetical protein